MTGMRRLIAIAALVIAIPLVYLTTRDGGNTVSEGWRNVTASDQMSFDEAASELSELLSQVSWSENFVQRRAKVKLSQKPDIKNTLPEIDEYPLTVDPPISSDDVVVEIFVTTIRAWSPIVKGRSRTADGRMVEVARAFNADGQRLSGGQTAKVRIRYIASGTGYQFIASRKYLPDAFSPVHHLWIRMAEAHGITLTPIRENIVTSVGGVVMKSSVAQKLRSTYGKLDIKTVINEVVQGNLAMGYTNPFHSSTGLNFLQTVLSTFAEGREAAMLSPSVVSTFERFQNGVPFVAHTTVQMRDAVLNEGSLDAFVMGYQTFLGANELQSGYEFIPFGVVHDHPLYAVGKLSPERMETLELLAAFAERPEYRKLALEYGWNRPLAINFKPSVPMPSGNTLVEAQKLWKEKKDAGRPIAAVFLSDISGSMAGARLKGLKEALVAGSDFISPENSIGLVLFDHRVRVVLPIRKFGINQRASFVAGVEDMTPSGGTAMYDGVAVALSLLLEEKRKNPDVRPILFVLSDGETNRGIGFDTMGPVITGIGFPVYTIGYEAKIEELRRLSSLVEAASLNASEGNVQYKIGSLLNSQM